MALSIVLGLLGLLAGTLTTLAGLGGGMLLVLALSVLVGPAAALAATAPALLAGNLQRLWMLRAAIDRRVARAFVVGALPGAFAGGLLAVSVPEVVLSVLMVTMVGFAIGSALGWWRIRVPVSSITPAGAAIGGLTATSGGAGLLAAPLLLSAGLSGETYVATSAVAAASMHLGRIAAYGLGGLFSADVLRHALVLGATILAGNLIGRRLRTHLSEPTTRRLEIATLATCAVLASLGLG
jgi:uncharacterized membrane protein YfcA